MTESEENCNTPLEHTLIGNPPFAIHYEKLNLLTSEMAWLVEVSHGKWKCNTGDGRNSTPPGM